jgi:NAD(P)-dependent dehydrogenase (short-subunit alcohol dehydrogenase family)
LLTGTLWAIAHDLRRKRKIIGIDLRGVFLCMKYEIPLMLKQGGGAIVNTSRAPG